MLKGQRGSPCWLVAAGLMLAGCATYSRSFEPIERSLAAQQPAAALAILEGRRQPPERDRLLYLLNKAMLLRMNRDFAASNGSFEQAKAFIERFSAVSVTEQTGTLLVNDGTRTYLGEPFEQVLIHLYEALNYLEMGDPGAARVEALQMDLRLRELADEDPDNPLTEDPFSRYLNALIYEERGEWSDAMIACRKAYEGYRAQGAYYAAAVPGFLKSDLLSLTQRLGLEDEHRRFLAAFGAQEEPDAPGEKGGGELVFTFHNGLAPIKREHSVMEPDIVSGLLVRVSLPYYERRVRARGARLLVGGRAVATEQMEDVGGVAVQTLEAHMPGIMARAIARAVAKHKMAREAGKDNSVAGLVTNVAGVLTERADTRSWLTLPDEIRMARVPLPPGDYAVTVEVQAPGGGILRHRLGEVAIRAGKKTYLSYHWVPRFAGTRH